MSTLFIADLHLCAQEPAITAGFLRFLRREAVHADALYILGDLFEAWIGDDDPEPLHAEIAAALMGSQTAKFFHEHTLVKQPGGSTVTPWHHDQPYYCVEGRQNVSLWIPLDPVAEAISLRCIRGSHRWDDEFSPTRFNGSKLYSHSRFKELPDIDAHQEDYDIVSWALEPGDAVAFHFRTLHGAKGNSTARARRVFSARWVGDDATFADRGGVTSPPFPGLKLRDGEQLVADEFPQVWPR